jgi:hypothetical protein
VAYLQQEFSRDLNFAGLNFASEAYLRLPVEVQERYTGMIDYLVGLATPSGASSPREEEKLTFIKQRLFEPVVQPAYAIPGYLEATTDDAKAALELEARNIISREAIEAILCDIGIAEQKVRIAEGTKQA